MRYSDWMSFFISLHHECIQQKWFKSYSNFLPKQHGFDHMISEFYINTTIHKKLIFININYTTLKIGQNALTLLTLFHPEGQPRFFQNHPQTASAKTAKLCEFKFLPSRRIYKKIPVNDITTSYDDVITKNGGANFSVKSLLNRK